MKTVLITGVSKGIGAALVSKFIKEGYFVIGTYLAPVPPSSENLSMLELDLSSGESINLCVDEIRKLGKKIDILINNAGILCDNDEMSVVVEKLRKTLEVNLIGTIDFTEKIIPFMEEDGHIINISSSAGSMENTGKGLSHHQGYYPSYKISKAAINMYTRVLALKLKDKAMVVSSVHPGWVKTDMGGQEADLSPEDAAFDIYKFAITRPQTGGFWFKGERYPW